MLNSNRPSNPTTLGRILAGERPPLAGKPVAPAKPAGIPLLELPLGQSIIFTCLFLLMMLVSFSMGVLVGKRSAPQPQPIASSATTTENDANALPPSSRKEASREQAAEDPLTKSPRTVSMPSSKNKVNVFPSSGLPIPPSDLAKATPPTRRATEYPAPGKPVSSTVPGAALPPSTAPASATSSAPSAPSHDAASQVAAATPTTAPPATPATKPISPVPAVETASPKTPATTATPPEGLNKSEKKTEPSVMPLPEKTPDPATKKETSPDNKTDTKEASPAKGTYCIQVASFSGENRRAVAEEYKKRLESNSELKSELVTSEDGRYVKVYVGSYPNKEAAGRECEKLRKRGGFTGAFVKAH